MSSKIKIAPSAKAGSHNWLRQRISAVVLIFLVIWLIMSLISLVQNPARIPIFFAYPQNAIIGILLVIFSLYHGSLGMKEIIEDYVSCNFRKHFLINLINFLSLVTALATVITILRLHLIG